LKKIFVIFDELHKYGNWKTFLFVSYKDLNKASFFMNKPSLAFYDCIQSIVYAFMLRNEGLISDEEYALFKEGLREFQLLSENQELELSFNKRDIFSPIDHYLKERLGKQASKFRSDQSNTHRLLTDLSILLSNDFLLLVQRAIEVNESFGEQVVTFAHDVLVYKNIYSASKTLKLSCKDSTEESHWRFVAKMLGFGFKNTPSASLMFVKLTSLVLHVLTEFIDDIYRFVAQHSSLKNHLSSLKALSTEARNDLNDLIKISLKPSFDDQSLLEAAKILSEFTQKTFNCFNALKTKKHPTSIRNKNSQDVILKQWATQKEKEWIERLDRLCN
jgi:hypothetical protein